MTGALKATIGSLGAVELAPSQYVYKIQNPVACDAGKYCVFTVSDEALPKPLLKGELDGEVLGLEDDGSLIIWGLDETGGYSSYSCDEPLADWGIYNLRPSELPRVGLRSMAIMPIWWTPADRETYRDTRDGSLVPATWVSQGCTPFDALAHYYKRVTADLETGEEVPA